MITERQLEVLKFIATHWALKGYAPSNRDIATALGSENVNTSTIHVKVLLKRGLLTREAKVARSMRLTEEGRRVLKENGGNGE